MTETQVRHITYGCGIITARDGNYIRVRFNDLNIGEKTFIYPDAFEKFITCDDDSFNAQIETALLESKKKAKERAQRMEKERAALIAEAEKARIIAAMQTKRTRKK